MFAETCARCHSSKAAEPARRARSRQAAPGPDYLECWNRYWAWTKTDEYKRQMRAIVSAPDFLDDNYLSTEFARPGDAAANQCLQPAGDQRARRQHLGQFLLAVLQEPAVGRHRHGA